MSQPRHPLDKSSRLNDAVSAIITTILVFGAFFSAIVVWEKAVEDGWFFPHENIAVVSYKNWVPGEYKTCSEPILETSKQEPQLNCLPPPLGYQDEEPKRFKVSFRGATYKEGLENKAAITWRCTKNDGTNPAFTCDERKVVSLGEGK